nr:ribonuclease H-like domain-containing protein [Tanacetum cinerariifolium]
MVAASKVPMLKPGKYDIQRMRIEQYILMTDYALWEVIENGAILPKINVVEGVTTEEDGTTLKRTPTEADLDGRSQAGVTTELTYEDGTTLKRTPTEADLDGRSQAGVTTELTYVK